jgi:hypothetical protein
MATPTDGRSTIEHLLGRGRLERIDATTAGDSAAAIIGRAARDRRRGFTRDRRGCHQRPVLEADPGTCQTDVRAPSSHPSFGAVLRSVQIVISCTGTIGRPTTVSWNVPLPLVSQSVDQMVTWTARPSRCSAELTAAYTLSRSGPPSTRRSMSPTGRSPSSPESLAAQDP